MRSLQTDSPLLRDLAATRQPLFTAATSSTVGRSTPQATQQRHPIASPFREVLRFRLSVWAMFFLPISPFVYRRCAFTIFSWRQSHRWSSLLIHFRQAVMFSCPCLSLLRPSLIKQRSIPSQADPLSPPQANPSQLQPTPLYFQAVCGPISGQPEPSSYCLAKSLSFKPIVPLWDFFFFFSLVNFDWILRMTI